jgi:hypothetical protein
MLYVHTSMRTKYYQNIRLYNRCIHKRDDEVDSHLSAGGPTLCELHQQQTLLGCILYIAIL